MASTARPLPVPPRARWLRDARLGLFCHFGLYSTLGQGEWAMNRNGIDPGEYEKLADRFTARRFDADALAQLAVDLGAHYLVFTTKHHEGFCLFDSKLTDYTAAQRGPRRDLVREVVTAARRRKLRVGLYYSLNDWRHNPSGLDALEDYDPKTHRGGPRYRAYIAYIHGQVRELLTNYGRIDTLWYDGWWPFDARGWQARRMNAMARQLQPHILVNNRNGLPGDFATPEQHLTEAPGRISEFCITLNDNWGFHAGDQNWKSPRQVVDMVIKATRVSGSLLLNVGPDGLGAIPRPSVDILRAAGRWVQRHEDALRPTKRSPQPSVAPRLDWNHHCAQGAITAKPGRTFLHITSWPGPELVLRGVRGKVTAARLLTTGEPVKFTRHGDRLVLGGMPQRAPDPIASVIELRHAGPLSSYLTGGLRTPRGPHPQYDPVAPNMIEKP